MYLQIRPHRQGSLGQKLHPKLAAGFCGPFSVLKQVGTIDFQLQLPAMARVYLVFHVSKLKKASEQQEVEASLSIQVGAEDIVAEVVLAKRVINRGHELATQVLVQ